MKIKLSKSQWEQIGKTAGWIKLSNSRMIQEAFWRISRGENKQNVLNSMGIKDPAMIAQLDYLLKSNPKAKEKDLPQVFQTSAKLSVKINKLAGGWGSYSEDLSDALETRVMINYKNGMDKNQILNDIKSDKGLLTMMQAEEMTDEDLSNLIQDHLKMISILNKK